LVRSGGQIARLPQLMARDSPRRLMPRDRQPGVVNPTRSEGRGLSDEA